MRSEVFIFHGNAGYPEENWFPWMKSQLENKGHRVSVPQFPTPDGQSLEAWLEVVDPQIKDIDEKTILIGHSLGGLFTLRLLERLEVPIKAAFLVGTPIGIEPIKNIENDRKFSGNFDFDWDKIRKSSGYFEVFHSDNDPYVALENGQQLARHLGVPLTFISNAGHFNQAAGYTKFERLLEDVNRVLIIK